MTRPKLVRRMARPARDFALGLLLFCAFAVSGFADMTGPTLQFAGSAHAGWFDELPITATAEIQRAVGMAGARLEPAAGALRQALAVMSLACAFALTVAVNLWFARHLRRAHAVYGRKR